MSSETPTQKQKSLVTFPRDRTEAAVGLHWKSFQKFFENQKGVLILFYARVCSVIAENDCCDSGE